MSKNDKKHFDKTPHDFKARYIFHKFNFDFKFLSHNSPLLPKVNLTRINAKPYTLELVLTYRINYDISVRKTTALVGDVHGICISNQSVLNYYDTIATVIIPYIDNYKYQLSNSFCSDKTYIKVIAK